MRIWLALIAVVLTLVTAPAGRAYSKTWGCPGSLHPPRRDSRQLATRWHLTRDWLGRPSVNHGGMQINVATWSAYAPRSFPRDPASATRAQQLFVAWRIFVASGRTWRQGSTASECS